MTSEGVNFTEVLTATERRYQHYHEIYFLIFLTSFTSGNVLPFLNGEITENRHRPGLPVSLGLFAMVSFPHPYLAFIPLEAWGGVLLTTNLT